MADTGSPLTFGALLDALCAEHGITLNALAVRSGLRRQSLYELRGGVNRPTLDTARRVAHTLGMSMDQLCDRLAPITLDHITGR